jgi:hypothetical protein
MSPLMQERPPVEPSSVDPVPERTSEYRPVDSDLNEFAYRPVPVVAVAGLSLALISSIGVFVWLVLPFCLIALFLSTWALVKVRSSGGAYGGQGVSLAGMALSFAFFSGGIGFQVYAYQTEVPEGYERISFIQDISAKGFVEEDGVTRPHPDIEALDGKQVFLKGYIYQTGRTKDLGAFLMVKDNQDCCFGANPALTDRVGVVMQDGKTIDYRAGKVAIAGTFRLNTEFNPGIDMDVVYIVEGETFSSRVSDF